MAFVNEYVEQEDIEKFELDELYNSYHKSNKTPLPNTMYKHYWTIDREKRLG